MPLFVTEMNGLGFEFQFQFEFGSFFLALIWLIILDRMLIVISNDLYIIDWINLMCLCLRMRVRF